MFTDAQIVATHAQSPVASTIKIIPFAEQLPYQHTTTAASLYMWQQ
jgi:hypothetical protein